MFSVCSSVSQQYQSKNHAWILLILFFWGGRGRVDIGTKTIGYIFGIIGIQDLLVRLLLICEFVKHDTSLLFARCQQYSQCNADQFSDDPDFNILYRFLIAK